MANKVYDTNCMNCGTTIMGHPVHATTGFNWAATATPWEVYYDTFTKHYILIDRIGTHYVIASCLPLNQVKHMVDLAEEYIRSCPTA